MRARRLVGVMGALLALACADATAPLLPADLIWDWSGTRVTPGQFGATCADTGSLVLHRQGDSISGRSEYVSNCFSGLGIPGPFFFLDSISGTASGGTFIYTETLPSSGGAYCVDTVTIAASGLSLDGHGRCGTATLTFHATPAAPVASVTIAPDSQSLTVGTVFEFIADLRTTSGVRVFGRAMTWSSSNAAVATIAPATLVPAAAVASAVGSGTTQISVDVEGHTGTAKLVVPAPVALVAVAAGDARTCGLDASGSAWCWGLGAGQGTYGSVPGRVQGSVHLTRISVGHDYACGLTSAGVAYCWGANASGQLGNGSVVDTPAPTPVSSQLTFASITAGYAHACALTAAGAAWCWGNDGSGRLGNASTTSSAIPVPVSGGLTFLAISAGGAHTCAVASGISGYCWGDNASAQLGDSTVASRTIPTRVFSAAQFTQISAGLVHSCGVSTDSIAYCWGNNGAGQIGLGVAGANQIVPTPINSAGKFTSAAAAGNHSCGVDTNGAAWCWGVNSWGQLGNSNLTMTPMAPTAVSGGLAFATISAGLYTYSDEDINGATAAHSCGVTTGGITWCWGVNNIGQIGNGLKGFTAVTSPAKVAGQP